PAAAGVSNGEPRVVGCNRLCVPAVQQLWPPALGLPGPLGYRGAGGASFRGDKQPGGAAGHQGDDTGHDRPVSAGLLQVAI
ncbi:hypothetical protein IWQ57_006772, partial [Coemansia nantahalensis]